MSLDPNKTYLIWTGSTFPNSTSANFKAPAGSTIDWGDGTIETFDTASTTVNTHTYTDGITKHTIVISGLTGINAYAFDTCNSLASITIANSVTNIGYGAFYNCSRLTSIVIPSSVTNIGSYAFEYCSRLTSIVIPSSVTSIGDYVFEYCSSLTSVVIPSSVTSIGDWAFEYCSSLTSVYYSGTVEEWNKITIGRNNIYLTSAARYYYSETKPTEDGIFWHYVNGEIVLWGFSTGLAYSLKADNSGYIVSGIGTCTDTEIVIPPVYNGLPVVSLAGSAFKNNTNITSVIIPDSVTGVGQDVFSGCTNLTSVTIGNGVTFMSWGMFNGCSNLTNVIIGSSVTTIGNGAFNSCRSLTSITIPNGVTTIGAAAFYNCTSLKSIVIPDSVKQFGSSVFQNCTSLKTIVLFPSTPPTLGSTNAIPTTISTIYVQQSSKEAYKTATNWTAFADKIESNDTYLSLVRFNKRNKEYIQEQVENIYKAGFDNAVLVTHSALLALRNSSNLLVGTWYRITDYVTTTAQEESQSANHNFDIIVMATAPNRLEENAFAIQHEDDTYFENSRLEAWKLKYCIDNDKTRFAWASNYGKGVIYELVDEFGNKCGYDFKNIQFRRYKVTACDKCIALVNGYYGVKDITGTSNYYPSGATISSTDTAWRYTFDVNGSDASIRGHGSSTSSSDDYGCYGNEIYPYYRTTGEYQLTQYLNNVVFLNSSTASYSCYRNRLVGARIYSSTFGSSCYSNTFANDCFSNTFGSSCSSNTFSDNCYSNTFGDNCSSNVFGNYCSSNIFGNNCSSNTMDGNNTYLSLTPKLDGTVRYHHFTLGFSGEGGDRKIECYQRGGAFFEHIFYKNQAGDWCCRYYGTGSNISPALSIKYKTSVGDTTWQSSV